jgi:hypothetical protein
LRIVRFLVVRPLVVMAEMAVQPAEAAMGGAVLPIGEAGVMAETLVAATKTEAQEVLAAAAAAADMKIQVGQPQEVPVPARLV